MNPDYTKIWLLLAFTLVILSFYGCSSQPPMVTIEEAINEDSTPVPTQQGVDTAQGPTDWTLIGRTLGCVFAPDTCK